MLSMVRTELQFIMGFKGCVDDIKLKLTDLKEIYGRIYEKSINT